MKQSISNVHKNHEMRLFFVEKDHTYRFVNVEDVAHFYSRNKLIYLHTKSNECYVVNFTLKQLEMVLNKELFYRLSRNCIANIDSIDFWDSKWNFTLTPNCPKDVLVKMGKLAFPSFKAWLNKINK